MFAIGDEIELTLHSNGEFSALKRKKQMMFEELAELENTVLANHFRVPLLEAFQKGTLTKEMITTSLLPADAKKALSFIHGRSNIITTTLLTKLYLLLKQTVISINITDCRHDIEF